MSDKVFTMEDDLTELEFDYILGNKDHIIVLKDDYVTLNLSSTHGTYTYPKQDFIQEIEEGIMKLRSKAKVYTEEDIVVGLAYKYQDDTITITEVNKGKVKVAEMTVVFTVNDILEDINKEGVEVTTAPSSDHHYTQFVDVSVTVPDSTKPIKSDGGSSSYYDITLTKKIVDFIISRTKEDGSSMIKTEELIEVLGSDFDEGNILKCLVRINSFKSGCGKEGNDVKYDANKIKYSADRLIEREREK